MSDALHELPQPVPLSTMPMPPVPQHLLPKPSSIGVTTGVITGRMELAVVAKVTYAFEPGKMTRRAERQLPLSIKNEPHDPLPTGEKGSMRVVPEVLAYATGTDVIVRATARPRRPVATMQVGVGLGNHRHMAHVTGRRIADVIGGRIAFTPPEPFAAMPLRYELAYGGVDKGFEAMAVAWAQQTLRPDVLRRLGPMAEAFLKNVPPISYPRNPHGKGYVLMRDEKTLPGRELPNIELPDDLLTPERLIPATPLRWLSQPVPAGFDFMDVLMFPRTAMMGLPPMSEGELDDIREVKRGQVPRGYSRGNALYADQEKVPGLIHPELVRCAPIGLRLPFLRGTETVALWGMHPEHEELRVALPGERPVLRLPVGEKERELEPQLCQIFIDVEEGRMSLIWIARLPWARRLKPGEDQEIAATVRYREPWTKV
jgi:hypothetical protein